MTVEIEQQVTSPCGHIVVATVAERFCPECGQPLALNRPTPRGWPIGRDGQSWALIAIGLLLVAGSGLRAATTNQAMGDDADVLWRTAGIGPGQPAIARPVDLDRTGLVEQDEVQWLLDRYAVARRQRDRALTLAGFGLLTVLIGFGPSARVHAQRPIGESGAVVDRRRACPPRASVLGMWAVAERLFVTALLLTTASLGTLFVVHLVAGSLAAGEFLQPIAGWGSAISSWFD
jgi:hypothetical protein